MTTFAIFRPVTLAAGLLALAGLASAEPVLNFTTGTGGEATTLSSVSLNISRGPQYDPETGMPMAGEPDVVSVGSIYVTRIMDSGSAAFIDAVANGTPLTDVSIHFDNGDTWTLTGAGITSYSTYSEEGGEQTENFDLVYTSADITIGGRTVTLTPDS